MQSDELDKIISNHTIWLSDRDAATELQMECDKSHFESYCFDKIDLNNAIFYECEFRNCSMRDVDFYKVDFSESKFHNCIFDGAMLSKANIDACTFRNVQAKKLIARKINSLDVEFYRSDLSDSDFTNSIMTRWSFRESVLDRVDLTGVTIEDCDFTGVILRDLIGIDSITFNGTISIGTIGQTKQLKGEFAHEWFRANAIAKRCD